MDAGAAPGGARGNRWHPVRPHRSEPLTMPSSGNQRILALDTIVRHGPGGVLYAKSPDPLGLYPEKLTTSLEHWAQTAPDRPFLVQRDTQNAWYPVSYGEMLSKVRAIAQ